MSRKIALGARILLGLVFTVFGLNFFLHFIPQPPHEGAAASFLGALFATGYVFPVIKVIEVVAGLMLLGGRFVPLALTLLAPIIVNIVLFHAVLEPGGLGITLAVLALELYLAWAYRGAFAPMLRADAQPTTAEEPAARLAARTA